MLKRPNLPEYKLDNGNDIYDIDFSQYFKFDGQGHGNGLIIKGGVGTAKTTMLSMITNILLEDTDFVFPTTIRFDDKVYKEYPNRLHYITGMRDYFEFYTKVPYSQPLLLMLDDSQGNEEFTSKRVLSDGGLASFLIYIRKFNTSYIYIAHQSYIPRSVVEGFAPYYAFKIDKNRFAISENFYEVDSEAFYDKSNIIVKMPNYENFDKHYLPTWSHAFTDFSFDIKWLDLKKFLAQYEVGEQLKEYTKIYLEQIEPRISASKKDKYEIFKEMSYQDIYITLCLKRGYKIPEATPLNEVINNQTMTRAKKIIEKEKLLYI